MTTIRFYDPELAKKITKEGRRKLKEILKNYEITRTKENGKDL